MEWVSAWSYAPINFNYELAKITNRTQRIFLLNNLCGNTVKMKFSNKYSKENLNLDKVTIGIRSKREDDKTIRNFTLVTLNGKHRIRLKPGEEIFSDAINLQVSCEEDFVISCYIRESMSIQSACSTWHQGAMHTTNSIEGDYTMEQEFEVVNQTEIYEHVKNDIFKPKVSIAYGVSEVIVLTKEKVHTIVAFGDSVTHMSNWTSPFATELYKKIPGKVTVINRGIAGNRILKDAIVLEGLPGEAKSAGLAGIQRFEMDVYGEECDRKVDSVIILEGINDIIHPLVLNHPNEVVNSEELIEGARLYSQVAHRHNSKSYIGTLPPCDSAEVNIEAVEECRLPFNEWILHNTEFDGSIDFSRAICKEENPSIIREDCHMGDGLHPNKLGGELMAGCVLQSWFE